MMPMKHTFLKPTIICLLAFVLVMRTGETCAQNAPPKGTRILIVLDGSRSMLSSWGSTTKMYAARQIIYQIADSVELLDNVQTGLRIFGHQSPQMKSDCEDSKLEVQFNERNAMKIRSKLNEIRPQGVTPISYSLEKAIGDFNEARQGNFRNVLIIVTDGTESCGLNPCTVVQKMKDMGMITKSYVLGLNVAEESVSQFECMGDFVSIDNPDDAKKTTSGILNKIFNSTTIRVDLLDAKNIPSETDIVMTFYDADSREVKYNFYHTIDPRGVPDTFSIDPTATYSVLFHTIPPQLKPNISIAPFSYNIITQDAAQGGLTITVRGESFKENINCIVKTPARTIDVLQTGTEKKYLVGKYTVEILTLPVITVQDVTIEQDKTTTIEIPAPGYCTFIKGAELFGGIYINVNNTLTEIYEFQHSTMKETIALQPGKYKIIYRYKGNKSMLLTKEKELDILTGTTITLNL